MYACSDAKFGIRPDTDKGDSCRGRRVRNVSAIMEELQCMSLSDACRLPLMSDSQGFLIERNYKLKWAWGKWKIKQFLGVHVRYKV